MSYLSTRLQSNRSGVTQLREEMPPGQQPLLPRLSPSLSSTDLCQNGGGLKLGNHGSRRVTAHGGLSL
eukprot:3519892-Rhodomonas_salina.2